MTRAALYARKSNAEDDGRAESVERQLEGGRTFVKSKGWTPIASFRDDAVSGARFETREGLQKLLRAAETGAFDVVVIHALDRLGRDAYGTRKVLYELSDAQVAVWQYSPPRLIELTGFEGGILTDIETRFGEWYRHSVRTKTAYAMRAKAQKGEPTGPAPYGYRNTLVDGRKAIENDATEVEVVVQIFERFANGAGLHEIMRWLNGARIPSPRGGVWSAPYVRNLLRRPLYRGWAVYGTTEMRYGREAKKGLEREQRALPEDRWIRAAKPELRIVSEELAARVDARLKEDSRIYAEGRARGAAPHKSWGRHLLSGILVCPACGTGFEARSTGTPSRKVYVCGARYRKAGSCNSPIRLPLEEADRAILSTLEREVLGGRLIDELLSLADAAPPDETERLTAERDRLRSEVRLLVESLAKGVPAESVADLVRSKEAEASRLDARLVSPNQKQGVHEGSTPGVPKTSFRGGTPARLRAALEQRTAGWIDVLRSEPSVARTLLKRLVGPISVYLQDEDRFPSDGPPELIPLAHENAELETVRLCLWRCELHVDLLTEGSASPALVQAGTPPAP